ncbi:hypothetical protein BH24ACT19_BH24ACT19_16960 [soil metagenome]
MRLAETGRPGAAALAILMWLFAIRDFIVELGMQSAEAVDALYEVRSAVFQLNQAT